MPCILYCIANTHQYWYANWCHVFMYIVPYRRPPTLTLCDFVGFPEAPSQPVGPLQVYDIQGSSLTLYWRRPRSDGGSPITVYVIEVLDTRTGLWRQLGTSPSSTCSYVASHLTEGHGYAFRVSAQSLVGTSKPLESDIIIPKRPVGKSSVPTINDFWTHNWLWRGKFH